MSNIKINYHPEEWCEDKNDCEDQCGYEIKHDDKPTDKDNCICEKKPDNKPTNKDNCICEKKPDNKPTNKDNCICEKKRDDKKKLSELDENPCNIQSPYTYSNWSCS
ncbi:hypothetical protein [Clostridium estertheticum]|uniref:hypothetical protein n=1 Tax=Clostridium estertheticum TaxID=238834 RepID=UPI001C0D525E|nr:hypothetical protein [Clostridium estertheticum]MBU3217081.1 hypothetical protein [Clostridium estertheticum]